MSGCTEATACNSDQGHPSLADRCTVVLITSPSIIHPDTYMLEEVACSLVLAPGLDACPKIIVADGFKMADHYKWKKGKVNEEYARRYQTYLARLHHLTTLKGSALEGAQLISLTRRHGFAHAVRRGVLRVRTPFVVIAQHDRTVIRPVLLEPLMRAMESIPRVQHVALLTCAVTHYEQNTVRNRYPKLVSDFKEASVDLRPYMPTRTDTDVDCAPSCSDADLRPPRLVPLIQFSDSMHIALTDHYVKNVFGKNRKCPLNVGVFLEDTYGQFQVKDIRENGWQVHAHYGTYLLEDGEDLPVISHMDGHDPLNAKKCRFAAQHVNWDNETLDESYVAWEVLERLWDERDFLGERYNDGKCEFGPHATAREEERAHATT